jgi:hypothetical protein
MECKENDVNDADIDDRFPPDIEKAANRATLTWKRCKHSGHFSRFRNIIGNFCIVKQKCYVIMLLIFNKK